MLIYIISVTVFIESEGGICYRTYRQLPSIVPRTVSTAMEVRWSVMSKRSLEKQRSALADEAGHISIFFAAFDKRGYRSLFWNHHCKRSSSSLNWISSLRYWSSSDSKVSAQCDPLPEQVDQLKLNFLNWKNFWLWFFSIMSNNFLNRIHGEFSRILF